MEAKVPKNIPAFFFTPTCVAGFHEFGIVCIIFLRGKNTLSFGVFPLGALIIAVSGTRGRVQIFVFTNMTHSFLCKTYNFLPDSFFLQRGFNSVAFLPFCSSHFCSFLMS